MSEAPKPPTLAQLMAAMGLPGLTKNEQLRVGNLLSRDYVCQCFAAAYLRTFSPEAAYREIHPRVAEGRRTRRWCRDRAMFWFGQPRVIELISGSVKKALRHGQLDVLRLARILESQLTVDWMKFATLDAEGNVTGFQLNLNRMTAEERLCVNGYKIARNGELVWQLTDRQRATDQVMKLIELTRTLGGTEEGATVPAELIRQLEATEASRQRLLSRLPASRVPQLIQGESKPIP